MPKKNVEHILKENQEVLEYLNQSRLFGGFPKETLQKLIPLSKVAQYPKGMKILEEGQTNDRIYFLIRGSVEVYVEGKLILTLQRIGDIFGEMSIIDNKPCAATIIAADKYNDIFSISSKHVGGYSDLHPKELQNILYRLFAKILTEKLNLTTSKAKQFETTNQLLEETKKMLEEDIIRRQQVEEELRISKEEAEAANASKTQFLANLTHDIRTPLGAIMGFNQILIDKGRKLSLPDDFQKFQENIQNSTQILSEMVNNFLDLSKIEAGKMPLVEEDFSIEALTKTIFHTYAFQASQKGVVFTYNVSPKLPATMRSDLTKILQILMNLVANAIKFTPTKKEVKLQVTGDEKFIAFMVVDKGIGIPKERQQSIFEPFEQGASSTVRNYEGTGLGLAIAKKLVEILDGIITVSSRVGEGSNFNVLIPFKPASQPLQDKETVDSEDDPFSKDNTILVVDDNLMNQELIEALFTGLGLEIYLADDGEQGVEKVRELKEAGVVPDLILMDMQMPGMDGIEATKKIREDDTYRDIPIVALSANAFTEQKKDAYAAGMNDYLTKPIDLTRLKGMLKKYLK